MLNAHLASLNVNAPSFVPNINAAVFVPTFFTRSAETTVEPTVEAPGDSQPTDTAPAPAPASVPAPAVAVSPVTEPKTGENQKDLVLKHNILNKFVPFSRLLARCPCLEY